MMAVAITARNCNNAHDNQHAANPRVNRNTAHRFRSLDASGTTRSKRRSRISNWGRHESRTSHKRNKCPLHLKLLSNCPHVPIDEARISQAKLFYRQEKPRI
jgi:hypothetical protein